MHQKGEGRKSQQRTRNKIPVVPRSSILNFVYDIRMSGEAKTVDKSKAARQIRCRSRNQ